MERTEKFNLNVTVQHTEQLRRIGGLSALEYRYGMADLICRAVISQYMWDAAEQLYQNTVKKVRKQVDNDLNGMVNNQRFWPDIKHTLFESLILAQDERWRRA